MRRFSRRIPFLVIFGFLAGAVGRAAAAQVLLNVKSEAGPVAFAAGEIEAALRAQGVFARRGSLKQTGEGGTDITLVEDGRLPAEAFELQSERNGDRHSLTVLGGGGGGVMYGGLELAEQIRLRGVEGVTPLRRVPRFAMRGTKFNLPLDVRTPSYSDMSDSAQENIETVWDFEFWREYLDRLARHRYNFVSLWNLHPFPSLVKVPGYEEVALDDVQRSTMAFDEHYSTRTEDVSTPAMLAQVTTVRRMTIEQKIDFWRRVMAYAKDRNIDFYFVTWNIYVFGTDGKYGITEDIGNPVTIDYFRKSVAQLFRTYPLLRGIGVTAGENLGHHDSSFEQKETWLFSTYAEGVRDVLREQPERPIRFIHRQHETKAQDIARTFAPLRTTPGVDFVFSFKYAQAHALSSTRQPFHHDFVPTLGEMKTLWTLRNDDALILRWAAPDFVREFLAGVPREVTQGIYFGSDMWVWGRDVLDLHPADPRPLEIEKHWLHWLLWGRLAYDPTLANERIAQLVEERFPGTDGGKLLRIWQDASMIYPLTTGFHWAPFDFQWYIEACKSRPGPAQTASGFHDVNRFITLGVHPGTDNVSIPRFVEGVVTGNIPAGTTPGQVARELDRHADAALSGLETAAAGAGGELEATLADIRAMAYLGKYYAAKIRGATALGLYRRTSERGQQALAIAELTEAARRWKDYTLLVGSRYRSPVWTNRVGYVNWQQLTTEVARDIEIAKEEP